MSVTTEFRYTTGGALRREDPTYVTRQADTILYETVRVGDYCFVFNSRQMGKSSLRVRAMQRLQAQGFACVTIEVSAIAQRGIVAETWYLGLTRRIARAVRLEENIIPWWNEREALSPTQRFAEFIEDVLLIERPESIVIFIDEIDSLFGFEFSDDFFAFVRACFHKRADDPRYQRITFVLLGVATPSDLITDSDRTPFNIGKAIDLTGFSLTETQPLQKGLVDKADNPESVLAAILAWTGGQPFLTQKVCRLIRESSEYIPTEKENVIVSVIIESRIIRNWAAQDEPEHLRTIRDRILRNSKQISSLLGLYQEILDKGYVAYSASSTQIELRLSGLVIEHQGKLIVYSKIYESVFDKQWVEQTLSEIRPYAQSFESWIATDGDTAWLLRGKRLENALNWAKQRNLSESDNHFLMMSQAFDRQNIRVTNERNLNRLLKRSLIGSGLFILILCGSLIYISQLLSRVRNSETAAKENEIEALVKTSEALYSSNRQALDALHWGMEAGIKVLEAELVGTQTEQSAIAALQRAYYSVVEKNRMTSHADVITDVAFSPDGSMIASSSGDNTVKLWDKRGNLINTLIGHEDNVNAITFSTDGQILISASSDGKVKFWQPDGSFIRDFITSDEDISSIGISPDGNQVVAGFANGTVKSWTITGKLIAELQSTQKSAPVNQAHTDQVNSISFSPDGQILATASRDGSAKLWTSNGELLGELTNHTDEVWDIEFSPDGKTIATASRDSILRLWNRDGSLRNKLTGHTDGILGIAFSPDGKTIASSGYDQTVRLWDIKGALLSTLSAHDEFIRDIAFSPIDATTGRSHLLVSASGDTSLKLWQVYDDRLLGLSGHTDWVWDIDYDPEVRLLATASRDGTATIWNTAGEPIAELKAKSAETLSPIWTVAFNPNNHQLATGDNRGIVSLWNTQGDQIKEIAAHPKGVLRVEFSSDGTLLATASADKTVKLWSNDGQDLGKVLSHQKIVWALTLSPDDQIIATGSADGLINLWTAAGEFIRSFGNNQSAVFDVAFDPSGQILGATGVDGNVSLWTLDGEMVSSFSAGDGSLVHALDFSADGTIIATTSQDGSVKIWNYDGELLNVFRGHHAEAWDVLFFQGGEDDSKTILASGSADGTAILWDVESAMENSENLPWLLERSCQWMEPYLQFSSETDTADLLTVGQYCLKEINDSHSSIP